MLRVQLKKITNEFEQDTYGPTTENKIESDNERDSSNEDEESESESESEVVNEIIESEEAENDWPIKSDEIKPPTEDTS